MKTYESPGRRLCDWTIRDMRCRDLAAASGILPHLPSLTFQNEFQRALTGLAWCEGLQEH